jgi:hypothetical protein
VTDRVDTLFDEYAARWARGEHPDAADYLEQAGEERGDLALLIDRYLSIVPAREPGEELIRFTELLEAGEPPLLAARVAKGLRREEVVRWVMKVFALPADKEDKVAAYWHELETGRRSPTSVAPELWRRVVEHLGAAAEAARGWRPVPAMDLTFHRVADEPKLMRKLSKAAAAAPTDEMPPDEVDRLFGYGS